MNERLNQLANEAAIYANQNSGIDRPQGIYWTSVFTEKYTELLVKDMATFFNKDTPARLAYELIQRDYRISNDT